MEQKTNIHAGHRQRLKDRIKKMNIAEIDDLYFLEHLLTYSIPRSDTNPIAHRLLNEFKTIDNIFEAEESALQEIEGVGPSTVFFLKYMLTVCYKYNKAKATKKPFVGTYITITNYLKGILPPDNNEQMVILCLNKALEVKNYKIIKGDNHSTININTEELINYLLKNKAVNCILAHTHPDGGALASSADIDSFIALKDLLANVSINLLDSIILAEDEYFSSKMQIKRPYHLIDSVGQARVDKLPGK